MLVLEILKRVHENQNFEAVDDYDLAVDYDHPSNIEELAPILLENLQLHDEDENNEIYKKEETGKKKMHITTFFDKVRVVEHYDNIGGDQYKSTIKRYNKLLFNRFFKIYMVARIQRTWF